MKKSHKKLDLNRETIRALDSGLDLKQAFGGTCWSATTECTDLSWCQDQQNQSQGGNC